MNEINEYLGTREGVNGYKFEKFSDLVGEILTLVEVVGLQVAQEKALKSKIKNLIWDMWDRPQYSWDEEELENAEGFWYKTQK